MAKRKKKIQEDIEQLQTWSQKYNDYRPVFILITSIVVLVSLLSYLHLTSLKQQSVNAWSFLGTVVSFMGQSGTKNLDLTIKDLSPDVRKHVRDVLKSKEALPQEIKGQFATLDKIKVNTLPVTLQKSVLRRHFIEQLEKRLPQMQNTTAAPWVYYCLGNLCYNEGRFAQAKKWYDELIHRHPKHKLHEGGAASGIAATIDSLREQSEYPPLTGEIFQAQEDDTRISILTTQGEIKMVLINNHKKAASYFSKLVSSGFYNGLTFYNTSPQSTYCGCPLGNGKSNTKKTSAETQVAHLQRGLVIMESSSSDPSKIDSRFYIVKQYPVDSNLQKCVVVAIVEEGMDIVDQLKNSDFILDSKMVSNE